MNTVQPDQLSPYSSPDRRSYYTYDRSTRFSLLGVLIDRIDLRSTIAHIDAIIQQRIPRQIVTVNPEFVMTARRDPLFRQVLCTAHLAVADGVGIVWAARILGDRLPERVGGVEVVEQLMSHAAAAGYRVYFLAAQEGVASLAAQRLQQRYPHLLVCGTYAGSPSVAEEADLVARIQEGCPDILLVAFGAPRQELWIARMLSQLNVPVAIGVGGAFDYLAGRVPRAPRLVQRAGLEWLYRLVRQPWRWRRMLALPHFAFLVLASAVGKKIVTLLRLST